MTCDLPGNFSYRKFHKRKVLTDYDFSVYGYGNGYDKKLYIYMPSALIEQEKEFKSFTLAYISAAYQQSLNAMPCNLTSHVQQYLSRVARVLSPFSINIGEIRSQVSCDA
jgi:hypothetical protein